MISWPCFLLSHVARKIISLLFSIAAIATQLRYAAYRVSYEFTYICAVERF